jgi:hypothetical protein
MASTHSTASAAPGPSPGAVSDGEAGRPVLPPGLLAGLAHGLGGEIRSHQPGPGAGGDLQAVATAAARQVQQGAAGRQPQSVSDLGDSRPGQQAGGQQIRGQAQMPLLDLILDRRLRHPGVPVIEVLR